MPVLLQKFINRIDLQSNPNVLYLFGDNNDRVGMGGQAGHMRGEPNACGIRTKWSPGSNGKDFFNPKQMDAIAQILREDFARPLKHHLAGGLVVVPLDGLGTGLSELPQRAPGVIALIQRHIDEMTA